MIDTETFTFSKDDVNLIFCIQLYGLKKELDATRIEDSIVDEAEQEPNPSYLGKLKEAYNYQGKQKEKQVKESKKQWIEEWSKHTKTLLNMAEKYITERSIKDAINLRYKQWTPEKFLAFIVELSTFTGYFPLDKKSKTLKFSDESYFSTLSSLSSECELCRPGDYEEIRREFISTVKSINEKSCGRNNTLLIVGITVVASMIAAPFLAAAIGGLMGLSGAAAISAGMALLGGGSIAVGGLGMAGGYFAIMAGGALLGYITGNNEFKRKVNEMSAEELLPSCGKLCAVIKMTEIKNSLIKEFDSAEYQNQARNIICENARSMQNECEAIVDRLSIDSSTKKAEPIIDRSSIYLNTKKANENISKSAILSEFRKIIRQS